MSLDSEIEDQYESQWAAIRSVAEKIGYSAKTLLNWIRQGDRDQGKRFGLTVARCTIERFIHQMDLRGVVSGETKHTTITSDYDLRPVDLVRRVFHANRSNQLWVAYFTYVPTWAEFVYEAFVIDVFPRMLVGLRVTLSMTAKVDAGCFGTGAPGMQGYRHPDTPFRSS